jgi:hypothetical protein
MIQEQRAHHPQPPKSEAKQELAGSGLAGCLSRMTPLSSLVDAKR